MNSEIWGTSSERLFLHPNQAVVRLIQIILLMHLYILVFAELFILGLEISAFIGTQPMTRRGLSFKPFSMMASVDVAPRVSSL